MTKNSKCQQTGSDWEGMDWVAYSQYFMPLEFNSKFGLKFEFQFFKLG